MNGKPVTASMRVAIVKELQRGDGVTQIARHHGLSVSPVIRIRREEGLQPLATDAEKISAANARDVWLLEARRRRAKLMVDLLSDAEKLRAALWLPAKVYGFGGKEYEYAEHQLSEPDFKGKQALMISIGIAIDKSLSLEKYDQEGAAAAKAAIIALVDQLGEIERAS
jgi:transposase-like protein